MTPSSCRPKCTRKASRAAWNWGSRTRTRSSWPWLAVNWLWSASRLLKARVQASSRPCISTGARREKSVRKIFASANALANKAGCIELTVEVGKANGFDPAWLRNAMLEPLGEADVRVQEEW